MAPRPDLHVYATPQLAVEALAQAVRGLSADSVAARGRFTVALSGGSTPAALYRLLASQPFADDIDWSRWYVFWGDERCVPPDHPDSNFGMARRTLFDHVPIPTSQVHRMVGEDPPQQAADDYALALANALAPDGRLDLALLGIGDDGHTASLFPGTVALEERERLVAANWVPHFDAYRITLTLPTLNRARQVAAVLATGADKAECRPARPRVPPRRRHSSPIALIDPSDSLAAWYLTQDAAADLPISPSVRPEPVKGPEREDHRLGAAPMDLAEVLSLWWVYPAALCIATLAISTGISGALFFVPFFLLAVGLPPDQAIGGGLMTMIFGTGLRHLQLRSAGGGRLHYRQIAVAGDRALRHGRRRRVADDRP